MLKIVFLFIVCLFGDIVFSIVAYCGAIQPANFTDVSQSAGIDVVQSSYGNPIWGDINNDGYIDIFMSNHSAQVPSLFLNNAGETFTNIVVGSELDVKKDRHGAAFGDYDNDGDLDIFITVGAARGKTVGEKQDMLFLNDGNGNYTDVTAFAGVANPFGRGRSVNWVDYDNDGYLDLFVLNYQTLNVLYHNNGDGTFKETGSLLGFATDKANISSWADYDKDGDMDLFIPGGPTQLLRNDGDGTFLDVRSSSGLVGDSVVSAVAWGDYNNDGNIDLYIARGVFDLYRFFWDASKVVFSDKDEDGLDFITAGNDLTFDLYTNNCRQNNLVFIGKDKKLPLGIPFTLTKENAFGQPSYIPDQDEGFFVWYDESGWHIRWSVGGSTKKNYFYGKITNSGQFTSVQSVSSLKELPIYRHSKLYENNGNGTFTDVTSKAGISVQASSHSASFGDYDNDGYLDIYIVNSGSHLGNGKNILYRNNGDDTFTNVANETGVTANVSGRGDGAAREDFNNDGFLDIYVTNGFGKPILSTEEPKNCLSYGPCILYKNSGNENRWLKINLLGTISNRNAIGTKVVLQANGLTQFRELNGGGGGQHYSQGIGPIHFGLGQVDFVDSLTIQWPSGIVQNFKQISANQELTIMEFDQDAWTEADDHSLWKVSMNGESPVVDHAMHVAGNSSISTTRTGTGSVALKLEFPENKALNQLKTSINFHVYTDSSKEKLQFIRILAPDWENRFIYRYDPKLLLNSNEWTHIKQVLSGFIPEAGTPDWNDIHQIVLNFFGGNGSNAINIDQFNFESSLGDIWTENEDIVSWRVRFNGEEPVTDPNNAIAGNSSISTTRTGEGSVALKLKFPENQILNQSKTSFNFNVYAENSKEKLQFIRIHAPDWENRFIYRYDPKLALNCKGWTHIKRALVDFTPEAGSPDWNDIDLFTLSFFGGNSPDTIKIDQLYFDNKE